MFVVIVLPYVDIDNEPESHVGTVIYYTSVPTSNAEIRFVSLYVCLFVCYYYEKKLFNRFSQNSVERWHMVTEATARFLAVTWIALC